MTSKFTNYPSNPKSDECGKAYLILCSAHETCSSFLSSFEQVRKDRKARGTPTDSEQDLLRAMLLLACAGLDSTIKQLINDALPKVIDSNEGAKSFFSDRLAKKLNPNDKTSQKLLAGSLISDSPKEYLLQHYLYDLTSNSLQSKDQIFQMAAVFDIPTKKIFSDDNKKLKEAFEVRNHIVHEMDVDFTVRNRNRRPRRKQYMEDLTTEIFTVSSKFLKEVDSRS